MAGTKKSTKDLLSVYLTGCIGSIFVLLYMLIKSVYIRIRAAISGVVPRPTAARPKELDEEKDWTHGYVQLSGALIERFCWLLQKVRLHYVSSGPADRPLLLMLHGIPECWYSWRHQLREFAKDYRCVALDLRGFNDSESPAGVHNYTLDAYANDLKEVIPALGYKKCFLLTSDGGSVVAWYFLGLYPETVDKMVACNGPHVRAAMEESHSSLKQKLKFWYGRVFQLPWVPELLLQFNDCELLENMLTGSQMGAKNRAMLTDQDVRCFKVALTKNVSGSVNFYRALVQYETKWPSTKIQVPSLQIWGTADGILGKNIPELSAQFCESYELRYLEGCSHWSQQDEPARVNAYIRHFLTADGARK